MLRIAVFSAAVPLLMRLPLPRLQRALRPRRSSSPIPPENERHVLALVDLALALLRPLHRPTCLTRGLTRYYFLRRAGVDVAIAFGMSATPALGGHCWLVRDGQPFLEPRDPRPVFAEMFRI